MGSFPSIAALVHGAAERFGGASFLVDEAALRGACADRPAANIASPAGTGTR